MVNYSKKIAQALSIIRKYYNVVYTQKTDNENVVYLFNYINNKKTIGSERIASAVEKAMKQQDFPKDIYYSDGMLSAVKPIIVEPVVVAEEPIIEELVIEEQPTEIEQPKKRGRKKQTETELDAES